MQNKQAMYALALGLMGFIATGDTAGLPRTAEAASPLAPAASVAAVNQITSVDVTPAGGVTKITVTGTLPFTPAVRSTAHPTATVITVDGTWSAGETRYTDVRKNDVLDVRAGAAVESATPAVRIVASTRGVLVHAARALTSDKTQWEIVVGTPQSVPAASGVARLVADLARPTTDAKTGADSIAAAMHVKMAAFRKPAIAAAPPAASVAAVLPAAVPAGETKVGKVAPVERRVSLDFAGADIVDVLKALSLQSGLNVVAGSDVKGPVTVTLKNVPMLEALDMVTRLSGYRYAKVGSTYVVGTGASIASLSRSASAQSASSAAISFYYSDGPTLEKSILQAFPNLNISRVDVGADAKANGGGLLPGGGLNAAPGTTAIDPATGAVVAAPVPGSAASINQYSGSRFGPKGGVLNVVGTPDEIAAVRAFVDSTEEGLITSARRQQDAQSKVLASLITETYKLKYASPSELTAIVNRLVPSLQIQAGPTQAFQPRTLNGSASFSSGSGATSGASPGGETAGSGAGGNTGAATTGNTPSSGPVAPSLLPPTLLLTGTQADIDRARQILEQNDVRAPQMQFEAKVVDINASDIKQLGLRYNLSRVVNFGEQNPTAPPAVGPNGDPARKPNFGTFYRSPYSITAALDALENDNKARVLARPNLSAMDGQSATVFIGDQVKYVVNIQNTPTGQNVTTETATVGITLKVTGKASPDGTITLYVHPEVSSISTFLPLGNGISLPQISTRFVDTTIRVKSGETIGIGGLIREDDIKNIQKIPVLGDIPFFGQLFRSTETRKIRSEVIVFITSRVLED